MQQNYQSEIIQMIQTSPHRLIFKNAFQKSKKQANPYYPYRTHNFRLKYNKKALLLTPRKLDEQISQQNNDQQNKYPKISFENEQNNNQILQKLINRQARANTPLIFKKSFNEQTGKKTFQIDKNIFSHKFGMRNEIQTLKQSQKPRRFYRDQNPFRSGQNEQAFRKTFCASESKNLKNRSLEMRILQKRPPSSQTQTFRPATRIRKTSNIGEQSNSNFLAKYEIMKQLGKGTYGTVYLAKIIGYKNKIEQNLNSSLLNKAFQNNSEEIGIGCSQNGNQTKELVRKQNSSFTFQQLSNANQQLRDNFSKNIQDLQLVKKNIEGKTPIQAQIQGQIQNQLSDKRKDVNIQENNQFSNQVVNLQIRKEHFLDLKSQSNARIELQNLKKEETKFDKQNKIQQKLLKLQEKQISQQEEVLVAIKVYEKFKMNKDPAKFKNIRKQITIMQNLSHQGVIKLYQSVQSLTKISLVVQFGGDMSLLDYLKKNFPLSPQKVKNFSKQLIDILIYLHQKNIVHRDIKPQNILVKLNKNNPSQQQLKLIDYGFSTLTNKSRKLNAVCGTPNFMAPELLSSKEYFGEKADVWSYGIVVFVMAQGRHPFKSSQLQQLERLVNKGKYIFKRKHLQTFEQFIAQILKVNSTERPTASQISKFKWFQQQ